MLVLSVFLALLALISIAAINFVVLVARQEMLAKRLTKNGMTVAVIAVTVLMLSTLVCSYGAVDALRG